MEHHGGSKPHPAPHHAGQGHNPDHHEGKGDGKKGGKKKGRGGLRYGAYGGYAGVPRSKAAKLVGADIHKLHRDTRVGVRKEKRQFSRQKKNINRSYKWATRETKKLNRNTRRGYNTAIGDATTAAAALQQTLANAGGAVEADANSELSRLGLSGTDAGAQIKAGTATSQQVAAQNSADNLANLGMMKANSGAVNRQLRAMIVGQRQSDIGEQRDLKSENITTLRDAYHEAQANRGDSVRQLLDQMAQTGWAQHMDQANLNLARKSVKKSGSTYTGFSGSRYGSGGYSGSNYSPSYGYGYSSSSGSSGSGSGSANAAKAGLYSHLLGMNP